MSTTTPRARGRALYALAITAAALGSTASLASPARAGDLRDCTNAAWADYNACLMETNSSWVRLGCDISFQAEYALCWSNYYKQLVI